MDRGIKHGGFTLIELMVAIAIAVLVITLSTPISNAYKRNRVTAQVHNFISALNMARSTAVTQGATASICVSNAQQNQCAAVPAANIPWENGWLIFSDSNNNCTVDGTDIIINTHAPLPAGYTLRENVNNRACIQYNQNGISANSFGTWVLVDPSASGILTRGINVSVTGRAQSMDCTKATTLGITIAPC